MTARTHTSTVLAAAFAASAALGTSMAGADVIGVDARNGFDADSRLATGADYDDFRTTITDLGHTIVPLTSFTSADLDGLDAVITHMPYASSQAFTSSEITALQNFVTNGGGYLMHADGGGSSSEYVANINELVAPYGITFSDSATNPSGLIVNSFNPHPVTDGLGQFGIDFQRRIESIEAPGIDLTTLDGDSNVMAAVDGTGGSGNLVFVSDTSCWKDDGAGSDYGINDLDNRLALENMINHILGGGGQRLQVAVSGNCPGTTTFDIVGATPNSRVALVYGFGTGPTTIPSGFPCAGTVLDVGNPNLDNQVITADSNGEAVLSTFVPTIACGSVFVQALDLTTCATSNVVQP
ncbi:MAG: hypothetical protein ACOC0P_01920 [Planctomycetota bacterium]